MKLLDCLPSNDRKRAMQEIMEHANKKKFQNNNCAAVLKEVSTKLIPANSMIKLDNLR